MTRVLHIPTGNSCNNRCTFCMERSEGYPHRHTLQEYVADLDRLRADLDDVVFTGGEPTLNPLLPDLVSAAAERGYRIIGLVSNGRALGRRVYCEDLLERGLNQVTISLHGPDAATHDAVTRRRGSFVQALRGLEHLASLRAQHPFAFTVNCTLVRLNLGSMRATCELGHRFGVDHVNFNVVEPRGTADELFEETVPRYSEVMRHADDSGLDFNAPGQSLSRVPPCAGGVEWVQEEWHLAHRDGVNVYDPVEGKVKGPPCESCAISEHCPGIWDRYVRGYGWDECIPVATPDTRAEEVLRVVSGSTCNNHCVHCVDGPAADGRPQRGVGTQLREGWLRGYRRVELGGGEPLMNETVGHWVRQARNLGYEHVALDTNARLLGLPRHLDHLLALGLDEVVVRMNAGDLQVHDEMARVEGAFRQSLKGVLQLGKRGLPFALRMREHGLNRGTAERMRELARQLGARRLELV